MREIHKERKTYRGRYKRDKLKDIDKSHITLYRGRTYTYRGRNFKDIIFFLVLIVGIGLSSMSNREIVEKILF